MKYCKYCGAELADDAAVCSRCGHSLYSNPVAERSQNKFGIAGFVLSLLSVQPLALIFAIIGLVVGKKKNDKVGLAIAGIVISAIYIVFYIIYFVVVWPMIGPMLEEMFREFALTVTALPTM